MIVVFHLQAYSTGRMLLLRDFFSVQLKSLELILKLYALVEGVGVFGELFQNSLRRSVSIVLLI